MSVVAAKVYNNNIQMSADSILTNGWEKDPNTNFTKIISLNDMIVGSVGNADECSLMWLYMENHQPLNATEREILNYFTEFGKWKGDIANTRDIKNSYLMAFGGHLFQICGYLVREIKDYYAIGAGAPYALTALHLGHDSEEAVKVSCAMCCFVCEPIVTYNQKKDN